MDSSRTNPSLFTPNYLHVKYICKRIREASLCIDKENIELLEVGAGAAPYKDFFIQKTKNYLCVDKGYKKLIVDGKLQKIPADVAQLPFENERFDVVLCTQVLSSVENTESVVNELHRVLKKDGVLILTDAFVWHNKGDVVLHRWAENGIKLAFKKFNSITFEPCDKTAGVAFYIANMQIKFLFEMTEKSVFSKIIALPVKFIYLVNNLIGYFLIETTSCFKALDKFNKLFFSNFIVKAVK